MPTAHYSLKEYNRKRDFGKTAEPKGVAGRSRKARMQYLIQKHDATRLHYDFRLEWEGVLKSWAVTRGPSLDPSDKRLAVRTEDHPLAYGRFEGIIPAKEYGGGTVMLWDTGWWEPLDDPSEGLKEGKLKFRLHGERLTGGWALVRMQPRPGEKRENWLLIKERDEIADDDGEAVLEENLTSIVSDRTMGEIAAGKGEGRKRVWHSDKSAEQNVKAGAVRARKTSAKKPRTRKAPTPAFIEPQLATLVDSAPGGDDWLSEVKFDGYRLLVAIGKDGVTCYSRSGLDWTAKFPDIAGAVALLDCDSALVDGEAVAYGAGSSFSALQKAIKSGDPISFYAFDLLHLDGTSIARRPLAERKEMLAELIRTSPGEIIRYSEHVRGHADEVYRTMCKSGQEGIIAKRAGASYRSGRSGDWVKVKCTRRQEFLIGGFSPSDKKSRPFASLLLGTFDDGKLTYRGRVGTGFNEQNMADLAKKFSSRIRKTRPFATVPGDIARGTRWLRPDLVAEIDFAELTDDGHVRHGVFRGLRADKKARSVVLEEPKAQAEVTGSDARSSSSSKEKPMAKRKAREAAAEVGNVVAGVTISNPDRVIYKERAVTKLDLARYYGKVARRFLAHAGKRPVSLVRCPQGSISKCFFQKHASEGFPDAITEIPITESSGETENYMTLDTAKALVSAVQMGTTEFHIWGSTGSNLEKPDRLVFDLDPDPSVGFDDVVEAALEVYGVLDALGLKSVPMVTGGKGVHVVVPLKPRVEWDDAKQFAKALATKLSEAAPDRYVATMSKAKRKGRIFIDYLRNERGSTAIAPYSVRARKGVPVAVPVSWQELEDLPSAAEFSLDEVIARLDEPDPWDEAGKWNQSLTKKILAAMSD